MCGGGGERRKLQRRKVLEEDLVPNLQPSPSFSPPPKNAVCKKKLVCKKLCVENLAFLLLFFSAWLTLPILPVTGGRRGGGGGGGGGEGS